MLFALLPLSALVAVVVAQTPSCTCSSGIIPVPVDVTIAADPSNPLGLNSTDTRRLKTTFEMFGVLCEPVGHSKFPDAVQVLLHGATYTTQYWDVQWGGFQNYSYVSHSCELGISSFSYDNICAGKSTQPANSTDCQMPSAANVASSLTRDLKSGRVAKILTGQSKKYAKAICIGHSQGSNVWDYSAIQDGSKSPCDGLILTGMVHDPQFAIHSPVVALPANQVDPARWGKLDAGYVTTTDLIARSLFFGPDPASFDPRILQLDELTKDVSASWISAQIKFTYVPAKGYKGNVIELVGSLDQAHCTNNNNTPCDQTTTQAAEARFWPDSKNFTAMVIPGFGHDLTLGYGAAKEFQILISSFTRWVQ